MKRVILATLLALLASPGFGQTSPTETIINALKNRGYKIVLQERTWLGRERVVAETDSKRREVVFNPGTGEILRDYVSVIRMADLGSGANDGTTVGGAISVGSAADVGTTRDVDQKLGVTGDTDSLISEPVADPIGVGAP